MSTRPLTQIRSTKQFSSSTVSPFFSSYIIYTLLKKFQDISRFFLQIFVKLREAEDKHPKYTQRKIFPKEITIRAEIRIVTSLSRIFIPIAQSSYYNKFSSMFNTCVCNGFPIKIIKINLSYSIRDSSWKVYLQK